MLKFFRLLAAFCLMSSLAFAQSVLISDFSSDENISAINSAGGLLIWEYDGPSSTLSLDFSNTPQNYLFGVLGSRIDVTGALGFELTAKAHFPSDAPATLQNPGNFTVYIDSNGVGRATAQFNFFEFVSPTPVTIYREFQTIQPDFSPAFIDQWTIVGGGHPTELYGEMTFTSLKATVPEPGTVGYLLIAGVLFFFAYAGMRRKNATLKQSKV